MQCNGTGWVLPHSTKNMYDEQLPTAKEKQKVGWDEDDKQILVSFQDGEYSLINDESRVVKGGSWKDRAYWLAPGSRRYLHENQATDYIGFRCVMDRVGPATNKSKSLQRKNSDLDRSKPIKATEKTKRRNDSQIKKYRRVNKRKQGLNIPY